MREFTALLKRRQENDRQSLYGAAMVCAMLANVNRDTKKHPKPFQPDEFMPKRKAVTKRTRQPWQVMKQAAKGIALAFGGKIVKKARDERSDTSS